MIVGFTGTRRGMTDRQKAQLREELIKRRTGWIEFHHGDCLGADAEAHDIAHELGYCIYIHPPENNKARAYKGGHVLKPLAYLERNRDIAFGCHVLIAAPKTLNEELRSGTWATIRYAREMGREVVILEP